MPRRMGVAPGDGRICRMNVTYRPGRPEDAAALAELVGRCDATILKWAPQGYTLPAPEYGEDAVKIAERVSDSATTFTVAAGPDEAPLGFSTFLASERPGSGHISNLFV